MKLIIGGYAQGRLAYVMQRYSLTEEDVWDAAKDSISSWKGQRVIYHAESLVSGWLNEGKNPCKACIELLPQWKDTILITQEVGCGLVPLKAKQREWREVVGRFNTLLAENSDTVERICCGLSMRIKGTAVE